MMIHADMGKIQASNSKINGARRNSSEAQVIEHLPGKPEAKIINNEKIELSISKDGHGRYIRTVFLKNLSCLTKVS
jgi:hypothetical protein